jgi:hypothetical protein
VSAAHRQIPLQSVQCGVPRAASASLGWGGLAHAMGRGVKLIKRKSDFLVSLKKTGRLAKLQAGGGSKILVSPPPRPSPAGQ